MDVSGIIPEAQEIVAQVAEVYLKHTAPWFIGLVAHGSAVKGGFIPGCSDIDFQLFLDGSAFTWGGQLPLALGFAIRRDLDDVDQAPFRYIQCYAHTSELREGFVGPIPGAYRLLAGRLPVAEATAEQLRASASKTLAELNPAPTYLMGKLLGPGGVRMKRSIRLLCTQVWPLLYQDLTLQVDDPIRIWGLPKHQAIEQQPKGTALYQTVRGFHEAVWACYPAEDSLEDALILIERGIAFLEAAKSWWDTRDL